ncbi:hypothetical protein PSECIP111951_01770 [Pseudoalteromonas holothuriae]|uniref:DUF1800 domain-containing protein n=1 Tax=Pseudoalteromonas holothuriae TaxID=2963714 RepID=A0ABM9GHX9_9GAMM|nr:DUF1800 domain-containing protein [Pseudoalteromonas sp. CIP111951]CAH9057941.1 hypothetical protein PSECIP111951_01770 [Pseudoalteromonas sp. CIP111951]
MTIKITFRDTLIATLITVAIGCGGSANSEQQQPIKIPQTATPLPDDVGNGSIVINDSTFSSPQKTARFLHQATFGATLTQIEQLTHTPAADWFKAQLTQPASFLLPIVKKHQLLYRMEDINAYSPFYLESTSIAFWQNAILGEDQLRQRMAYALSQILVVSNGAGDELSEHPEMVASFQDILIRHAFGNYRTLLEDITYSPAMGYYLTYLGNQKGNAEKGTVPDENYARELLQLFTLGLVALNQDGSPVLDSSGHAQELYSNKDITGLARVFTGLNYDEDSAEQDDMFYNAVFSLPMTTLPEQHSTKEKPFLGLTIPANTDATTSIDMALDHIFAHPNLGPFIAKQLIQRFTSSNPTPKYIARAATAFNTGKFQLPDGAIIGDGQRGSLSATLAAILFDSEARNVATAQGAKIREPILRFTQWARTFKIQNITPQFQPQLWDTSYVSRLAQHPYRAPSVFNFYRPGYKAPGSITASNNLVAPELEITNASTIAGYTNFMTHYIFGFQQEPDLEEMIELLEETNIEVNPDDVINSFLATYQDELNIAHDLDKLIAHLDFLLTANQMSASSKSLMKKILREVPIDEEDDYLPRVQMAILLTMTSPDYLVQK